MAENPAPELAPLYYRDNFLRLCDAVEAQYTDLLQHAERQLLNDLRALPGPAQCLYVRLISRTGPWFRESKLQYAEIAGIDAALDQLLDAQFAIRAVELELDEAARIFTLPEFRAAFDGHIETRGLNKAQLLDELDARALSPAQVLGALAPLEPGRVVAPAHPEFIALLQVLFFGNRHQSLTDFVLEDLGVVRHYPYALDREQRLFQSRAALDEYLALAAIGDSHRELLEESREQELAQLAQQLLELDIVFPSSRRRRDRLYNQLARDLERQEALDLALSLYDRSGHHPSRERRARILEKQGELAPALALCEAILQHPWCEAEQEAALRIAGRLQRKLHGTAVPRPKSNFSERHLCLTPGEGPVEQLAAAALAEEWREVHYVENSLMNSLFGLAFWEQIFAPLPGAFAHPYQGAPLDMYEPDFRARREDALAKRMAELNSRNLASLLLASYERYFPYLCHWLDWRYIDAALVQAAAETMPAAHLCAIWERMLFDPRENRSGFPDLIALGSAPGDYCMIEVKGPGDALQDSQRRWLRFFQRHEIPAKVLWVSWDDD